MLNNCNNTLIKGGLVVVEHLGRALDEGEEGVLLLKGVAFGGAYARGGRDFRATIEFCTD